jgi:hypothetical protein
MSQRQFAVLLAGISSAVLLAACGSDGSSSPTANGSADSTPSVSTASTGAVGRSDRTTQSETGPASGAVQTVAQQGAITVTIGEAQFLTALADTETARAFSDRLPLTLDMTDVNNNEKAFTSADDLPSDPESPGTIHNGDLMLYGSNTIVLFYESFQTSYTYTRIGRLNTSDGLAEALGAGDVKVTFAHQ